jgi:hypothetical protein
MTSTLRPSRSLLTPLLFAIALASAPAAVLAMQNGTTDAGIAYVSGGASDERLALMRADRLDYSFWLSTAALGSGAYLAEVQVKITEAAGGKEVLSHKMDGPWLFVSLPTGRYVVEATHPNGHGGRPETHRTTVSIAAGDHRKEMMYFDTGDLVGELRPNGKTKN